jgi:tetratricopeptide (TPR) repeat protein
MLRNFLSACVLALLPTTAFAYINAGFKSEREYQQHLERERAAEVARATEAIRRAPGDPAAYYYRGTVHSRQRNYEPAVADYDRAIQLDPKFARAYFRRGQALLELGWVLRDLPDRTESARLTARAMADLEKATHLDPKLVEAQVFFAAHTDDLAKAIRAAELACEHTDNHKSLSE